jgi:hypothetical protein
MHPVEPLSAGLDMMPQAQSELPVPVEVDAVPEGKVDEGKVAEDEAFPVPEVPVPLVTVLVEVAVVAVLFAGVVAVAVAVVAPAPCFCKKAIICWAHRCPTFFAPVALKWH